MEENILMLGATSDMAVAIARKFASEGYALTLAARNVEKLQAIEADLSVRYDASVNCVQFDALDFESHEEFYKALPERPDIIICVFGFPGNQEEAQDHWKVCEEILLTNYAGAVSILNIAANDFEKRKNGTIVGISSVAGERGRQSNYFYGSAKAGFTAYLSGLRNRLYHHGVHVLTVKPGFVRTKMIEGIQTPSLITASPALVADKIYRAVKRKSNSIYVSGVWVLIMLAIRNIPENIFKRLRL